MNDMNLSIDHAIELNINLESSCFLTKDYRLLASDLAEVVKLAACDYEKLSQTITDSFQKLKKDPNANPILVGAIPFDTTQASSLNIYRNHRKQRQLVISSKITHSPLSISNQKPLIKPQDFAHTINIAIDQFRCDQLEKVVLSQAVDFELSQSQNPFDLVDTLAKENPHAFSFAIPVEDNAYLLGASPELLISKNDLTVRSNPLAGSRPLSEDENINQSRIHELYASEKDLNEHQIVVDSVLENLKPFCQKLKVLEKPEILKTATMLHLSTVFDGQLKKQSDNALQLALALHPTPAICGSPTEPAKQFILEHEGYDRHYFAGLVGWMDAQGNGEWAVTIRCGLLNDKKIRLYAGAGIVMGSQAELEWSETEVKMQTLLKTLSATFHS
ncbi:isochorismate synthase [Acinetobacter baylyi]|uniref:isochorismate synthase n=1 Tax=Acinetobacter baylyi TaxID=202950 RepID=UPI0031D7EFD3